MTRALSGLVSPKSTDLPHDEGGKPRVEESGRKCPTCLHEGCAGHEKEKDDGD